MTSGGALPDCVATGRAATATKAAVANAPSVERVSLVMMRAPLSMRDSQCPVLEAETPDTQPPASSWGVIIRPVRAGPTGDPRRAAGRTEAPARRRSFNVRLR